MLPDVLRLPGVHELIVKALDEDVGSGDVTSLALIPRRSSARAALRAREPAVVAGAPVAAECFRRMDSRVNCRILKADGQRVQRDESIMEIRGSARGILAAERVALNFIQRLSGVATLTARFVRAVGSPATQILDTRKTTPGMRVLEKYAVLCGGGHNHRLGLHDRVLIKDNHRHFWSGLNGSLADAVRRARRKFPRLLVEIEVETIEELQDALRGRPDWILLDNMQPADVRRCMKICNGQCLLEVSGGVNLQTIRRMAATAVDAISVGRITHSAPAIDLSLDFI